MEKVRYGIIGVGAQGHKYAEFLFDGYDKNAVLTAVCDEKEDRRKWAEGRLKGVQIFADYKEMSKNCLIYETLNSVDTLTSHKASDGLMHLKGVFGVCGVRNNNSRVYEHNNYAKMVSEMKKRIEKAAIPGELEHPSTMNITLENVSHKIIDIDIDENGVVSGEIALLDTPKGKIAQAIVEGGLPLFISSRAQGSVDQRTGVVTLESLATYDLVGSPGFSQAELHLNESQVVESINESNIYYITEKENQEPNNMDKELQDKFEALEQRIINLEEENENLKEQLENSIDEQIDIERLANSIQKWIVEEYSPEVQNWVLNEASHELVNEQIDLKKVANGIQKWILEDYSPVVQKWVTEEYSSKIQDWIVEEFAQGIQNWIVEEFTPTVEEWINENKVSKEEPEQKVTESIAQFKNDKMAQINETLQLLESMDVKKPVYKRQSQQVDEGKEMPKYIMEMPADKRVKYDLASQEVKESIARRAKLYNFLVEGAVEKFWEGIDFDQIKPTKNIYEGLENIEDEQERLIRAQIRRFHKKF